MNLTNVDLDSLRALVIAQDLGGYGRAAEQLGRTPSAISLQMKRLQEEVGVPLFRRQGKRTLLTEQGEIAVRYARRVLELNDEMLDTLRGASLSGVVRVGFGHDFVDTVLPVALARFNYLYPLVKLEVTIDRNSLLEGEIGAGKLDVALTLGNYREGTGTKIGRLPLCWIASSKFPLKTKAPLPLVLFEHPCIFRTILAHSDDEPERRGPVGRRQGRARNDGPCKDWCPGRVRFFSSGDAIAGND